MEKVDEHFDDDPSVVVVVVLLVTAVPIGGAMTIGVRIRVDCGICGGVSSLMLRARVLLLRGMHLGDLI